MTPPAPQPSWRKPAGALLIIGMIAAWAVLVSTAMDYVPDAPMVVELLVYAVAGVIWIVPARSIVIWMETGRWSARARD